MPEGRLFNDYLNTVFYKFVLFCKNFQTAKTPMTAAFTKKIESALVIGVFMNIGATEKSVSKSLSALCAASLKNCSAVCSFHSLSEAMLLFSLTLFGLISSEHSDAPP